MGARCQIDRSLLKKKKKHPKLGLICAKLKKLRFRLIKNNISSGLHKMLLRHPGNDVRLLDARLVNKCTFLLNDEGTITWFVYSLKLDRCGYLMYSCQFIGKCAEPTKRNYDLMALICHQVVFNHGGRNGEMSIRY